jgi:class 3 adenylate cyclase
MNLLEIAREVRRHLEASGRLSYRMLRREFSLDDDTLAEVVEELVDNQRVAVREDQALAWSAAAAPSPARAEGAPAPPQHLTDRILHSRAALEGERRQVTVLFSDVSGFTAMSEKLDPEDVRAIMDSAFEVILNEVHRYEGTVNQFLGDGVMALFGVPVANDGHAQRALSAALAIQRGLQPLADEVRQMHGVEFRMRIGINTGPVVVGAIGRDLRMDYTAVGDTTNLAARLLHIAKPGQIAVSRRTQQLSAEFFVFEDLGDFQVKGTTELVHAYAVSSEISGQTSLELSREREQEIAIGSMLLGRVPARDGSSFGTCFTRAAWSKSASAALETGRHHALHTAGAALEHPSALPRHDHHRAPLLRPSGVAATAAPGSATRLCATTRALCIPPPSRAGTATTPWPPRCRWWDAARRSPGINRGGARQNCARPGTLPIAGARLRLTRWCAGAPGCRGARVGATRRLGTCSHPLLTGRAQRFMDAPGAGLGCFGTAASRWMGGRGGLRHPGWVVAQPDMKAPAEQDERNQQALVQQRVRHHGDVPFAPS